jgi:hypothetical protein
VQHFPTAHIDDLDGRIDQLMAARFAYALLNNTNIPSKFCSYCYNPTHHQCKCPFINHYVNMINKDDASNSNHEHVKVNSTLGSEEIVDNNEEEEKGKQVEHSEQVEHPENSEPPTNLDQSSDMEVSTETLACITDLLKTHQESKASSLKCLKEPSYVKILKDSRTQAHKSRNHFPKKIIRSKQLGYIRW